MQTPKYFVFLFSPPFQTDLVAVSKGSATKNGQQQSLHRYSTSLLKEVPLSQKSLLFGVLEKPEKMDDKDESLWYEVGKFYHLPAPRRPQGAG